MRALAFLSLCGLALRAAAPAQADVQSYCEAYARDQADARLSGGAILGAQSSLAAAEREELKTLALADCLVLYAPKLKIEPVTVEAPIVNIARKRPITAVQPKPLMRAKPKTTAPAKQKAVNDPWKSFDDPGLPVSR